MAKKLNWYSVRGLQEIDGTPPPPRHHRYVESIVVVRAANEAEAEKKGLRLLHKGDFKFLGHFEVCELFDDVKAGAEVYWTTRLSPLSPAKYVRIHWGDGKVQSCTKFGWEHRWYNKDGKRSACYYCKEVRNGQLWKNASDQESR